MKKLLLATSILAGTAGLAAAEVTISGSARMGLIHHRVGPAMETEFLSRVRVSFSMTGTTDGGLEFGASVDGHNLAAAGTGLNTANGSSTVFISGAFGKLTMGDTGNAADALVGQVSGVGLTGLGDNNEIGFLNTTKTGALYQYSTGALTVALGSAQTTAGVGGDVASIAVKYATDAFSIAVGFEDDTIGQQVSMLGSATFGGATVKLKLADRDTFADMAAALSVDYTTGAATITAFATDNVDFLGKNTAGLGVSYDLGGGASVKGGVVDNGTDTIADLGVSFSF